MAQLAPRCIFLRSFGRCQSCQMVGNTFTKNGWLMGRSPKPPVSSVLKAHAVQMSKHWPTTKRPGEHNAREIRAAQNGFVNSLSVRPVCDRLAKETFAPFWNAFGFGVRLKRKGCCSGDKCVMIILFDTGSGTYAKVKQRITHRQPTPWWDTIFTCDVAEGRIAPLFAAQLAWCDLVLVLISFKFDPFCNLLQHRLSCIILAAVNASFEWALIVVCALFGRVRTIMMVMVMCYVPLKSHTASGFWCGW